ncbi:hypothetical protein [Bradyrhizobium sp.]|uniref:hypothetical protein n=1 Tax=Bradyrhizobium sp. TaxID=376 RepID=UPI0039E64285
MPIFRYFVFVGGALLALLFAVDFILPTSPVAQAVASADTTSDQPLIRIRSDRHLPERVVFDTNQPMMGPPVVTMAAAAPPQATQESISPALAEMSAKARVRETFAQFTPAAAKADPAAVRKAEAKPQVPPRHRVARVQRQAPPQWGAPQWGRPTIQVAQQPHFGLFNTTW